MKIGGRKEIPCCETCALGKMMQHVSRKPDERSTAAMEFVHSDICGPVSPVARGGFRYALSFVDDYSGALFMYYIKEKSDAPRALEQFLADSAPHGVVKRTRTDNANEYVSEEYKQILVKNKIKMTTSCPHSPHQNGTAERGWRTVFEMARCLLSESNVPKSFWTYAVMASVYIRNRCYSQRTQQTPYSMINGKIPDVSKMHVFGTTCYAYETSYKKKLDDRSKKGVFLGYDKGSPAYLVYYPASQKIMKHRCVKFTDKFPEAIVQKTNSSAVRNKNDLLMMDDDDDDFPGQVPEAPEEVDEPVVISDDDLHDNDDDDDSHVDDDLDNNDDNDGDSNDDHFQDSVVEPVPDEADEIEQVFLEYPSDDVQDSDETIPYGADVDTSRYPARDRRRPSYLNEYVTDDKVYNVNFCYHVTDVDIPKTYTEAINSPQSAEWKAAMDEEIHSLTENNTYEVCELPAGKQSVGGRWVYATKIGKEDSIRYKARWVAKGFTQQYGSDYLETFAPTCKITTVRTVMQIAAEKNLILHQMDVKTAYLNAPIDFEIYMDQPKGYVQNNGTCKLNKSLYGLKQSGRNWNLLLHEFFTSNKLIQSKYDPCVYTYRNGSDLAYILLWVDDIVIAGSSKSCIDKIKGMCFNRFNMKDLGPISWFLGIEFQQSDGVITMSQSKYLLSKLEKFGLNDARPRTTPCEIKYENNMVEPDEANLNYREMVGSLIYAMTCTRPDLSWAVTRLSQHLSNPTQCDFTMVKHVFKYILGTLNYKLEFRKSNTGLRLHGYSDANWGESKEDRKSITGYYFCLNEVVGPAISWKSKRQQTVALSSCESEYMALTAAAQEALYLSKLLNELINQSFEPVQIYGDNQGAIALTQNPIQHQRSKHIDIRYHFIRDYVQKKNIEITYVPTDSNVADLMTKPCSKIKLRKFNKMLFG